VKKVTASKKIRRKGAAFLDALREALGTQNNVFSFVVEFFQIFFAEIFILLYLSQERTGRSNGYNGLNLPSVKIFHQRIF
tara:strand:+ start:412 stop:651 length:240 start_codon:yes stop_codon:yes gene_type:complete